MGKFSKAMGKDEAASAAPPASDAKSSEEKMPPPPVNEGKKSQSRVVAKSTPKRAKQTVRIKKKDRDSVSKSLVTVVDPDSIMSEQFRLLKNNILFPEKGTAPRSIMITSPSPNEGKSFVAANLAVSIAKSIDEFVLLMDCDLRAPAIHELFNIDGARGLSDYLASGIPIPDLLAKTFFEKLTILPGGTIPHNPSELLSSEQMRRLLSELKTRYTDRYIIVDAPPPHIASETNAIARIVDGIIIVVRQGKTRKKNVENLIDIYGRDKIIGVIKNFSKKEPFSGNNYYNQYRYYRSNA